MKAGVTCAALCRIMPNTRGPKYLRRKILADVVRSVILYAAPVWWESTKLKTYRHKISSVYRLAALRVSCAFKTVSDEAAFVIAGLIPIDLMAKESGQITSSTGVPGGVLRETVRAASITEWQARWSVSEKGRWTHKLIPDVGVWLQREHGQLNYYLTQFLSGHGCFRSYLYKFGHDSSPFCQRCSDDVYEDPEHIFFICPLFVADRENLEQLIGSSICPQNIVNIMLSSLENWEYVCQFVKLVLLELRRLERMRMQN